jgi:EPS-associated MarR family transcriptional regulator
MLRIVYTKLYDRSTDSGIKQCCSLEQKAAISASLHAVAMTQSPNPSPAPSKRDLVRVEAGFAILGLVQDNPNISIAEISRQLGVSNGMAHYVLRSLIDKGSVKVKNFSKNPNKRNYSYILTPTGLSEKLKLTSVFLEPKRKEYYALQQEINALDQSV